MPPNESDSLLHKKPSFDKHVSLEDGSSETSLTFVSNDTDVDYFNNNYYSLTPTKEGRKPDPKPLWKVGAPALVLLLLLLLLVVATGGGAGLRTKIHGLADGIAARTEAPAPANGSGPYSLVEAHEGRSFFDYYDFEDGPDSAGSAGYNTYVGKEKATKLGLARADDDGYVYLSSEAVEDYDEQGNRFRDSVRLEGKTRFDHGLILLDVARMPSGCGVWPAFWTTDEEAWPHHGEIDIVEPINTQTVAKTALHTSEGCDMYAHVPRWEWTGHWDSATGLPDTFTGKLNLDTKLEADNCWTQTPHQWANQGCVAISDKNGTIGAPMNEGDGDNAGGGVYALEWDPSGGHIRSWVFARDEIPSNLRDALGGSERPDPSEWPTPYAYFAIGEGSGCPSERFRNHRIVINLAFCGAVAGNRFRTDCPALYEKYNVDNDSVATCNAYLDSPEGREALEGDAYWKIKGVRLYQRDEEENKSQTRPNQGTSN
mmetsp:Transcript_4849/g.11538  ORF Transcript_4849/g.11538 Transcript_4849/m.11538 type:complete len:485 (-) Transcript_4849:114-1568(-)